MARILPVALAAGADRQIGLKNLAACALLNDQRSQRCARSLRLVIP